MAAQRANAQPVWQVAVSDINNGPSDFTPGDPAEPGLHVDTYGTLTVTGPNAGSYPFFDYESQLQAGVEIPAGIFDWGRTSESFSDIVDVGLISGADAFVIDGDNSSDLHVHWTLGVSYDAITNAPVTGHSISVVETNSRIRLTGLIPSADYRISWDWATQGDAQSATGFFNCGAHVEVSLKLDGAALPSAGNPVTQNDIFAPNVVPMSFSDDGDDSFVFTATPGFTCDKELLITLVTSASAISGPTPSPSPGLSTASTFGDLNISVEKLSVSPREQLGDLNCDEVVNSLDIAPFMMLLLSEEQYDLYHPCCPKSNGDFNLDQQVTVDDLEQFVDALLAGV